MSHAGVGWALGPVPLSQSTSAGGKGPLGVGGKDLGGPGAVGCEREVVFLNGWDILGRDAARLERRWCRVQVLQGKVEEGEGEGEGEMLPSLHYMQQGWESTSPRVFPHLAPLLSHGFRQSLSNLRFRTPMAAKGWRQAPSSTGR